MDTLSASASHTVAFANWRYFDCPDKRFQIYAPALLPGTDNSLEDWISMKSFVPTHGLLWRREDIRRNGPWDEALAADQDGEFILRFFLSGGRLVYCPSAWIYYRTYPKSGESIRESVTRDTFESRLRVSLGVERALASNGTLAGYREAFSLRYAFLAKKCALHYRDLTNDLLCHSRRLSPSDRLPVNQMY